MCVLSHREREESSFVRGKDSLQVQAFYPTHKSHQNVVVVVVVVVVNREEKTENLSRLWQRRRRSLLAAACPSKLAPLGRGKTLVLA